MKNLRQSIIVLLHFLFVAAGFTQNKGIDKLSVGLATVAEVGECGPYHRLGVFEELRIGLHVGRSTIQVGPAFYFIPNVAMNSDHYEAMYAGSAITDHNAIAAVLSYSYCDLLTERISIYGKFRTAFMRVEGYSVGSGNGSQDFRVLVLSASAGIDVQLHKAFHLTSDIGGGLRNTGYVGWCGQFSVSAGLRYDIELP